MKSQSQLYNRMYGGKSLLKSGLLDQPSNRKLHICREVWLSALYHDQGMHVQPKNTVS